MKFKIVGAPTVEPVTLCDARNHLRIEAFGYPLAHPDDSYITALISVAREWCEQYIRRALATQTVNVVLDEFSDTMVLPITPVQSVTSIKYLDVAGVEQTLPSTVYYVDTFSGAVKLNPNQVWPTVYNRDDVITIDYKAGYTTGETLDPMPIPFPIRAAMLLIVGSLYENRQQDQMGSARITYNSLPLGVYNLLQPYRNGLGV